MPPILSVSYYVRMGTKGARLPPPLKGFPKTPVSLAYEIKRLLIIYEYYASCPPYEVSPLLVEGEG